MYMYIVDIYQLKSLVNLPSASYVQSASMSVHALAISNCSSVWQMRTRCFESLLLISRTVALPPSSALLSASSTAKPRQLA